MAPILLAATAVLFLAMPGPGRAQTASGVTPVLPGPEKIVLLTRSALLTLNDALQTGNFTVLRDKAAPDFAKANTAARLGRIFESLASIDLAPVAIIAPQLSAKPTLDANNYLHLKGFFPGQPVQINFSLVFQPLDSQWRLYSISVNPIKVPVPAAVPDTTPQKPKPPQTPKAGTDAAPKPEASKQTGKQ
ncbi:MAG: hypothetical protein RLZ98_931 [Pseudomonadota bacterium]|jgi:hypothetical protein